MSTKLENVAAVPDQHLVPGLIDPTNYAGRPKDDERVRNKWIRLLPQVRSQRASITADWQRYYAVWEGTHSIRYYEGQADLKIKMIRKVCDTFTSHVKAAIWPENDLYEIIPGRNTTTEAAEAIRDVLDHDIEQAGLRDLTDLFLDTGWIYGIAVLKSFWGLETTTNYSLRNIKGNLSVEPEELRLYEGPQTELVDPLRFYVYPIQARQLKDAEALFEDRTVTESFLRDMEAANVYRNVQKVIDKKRAPDDDAVPNGTNMRPIADDTTHERDSRINAHGFTVSGDTISPNPAYQLTEIWAKHDLKGDGRLVPCKITVVEDEIVEIRQNPFFDQEPPYLMWRVKDLIDNVYGQSLVALIEDYQYAIDALFNQAIDSANFQINHITYINETYLDSDQIRVAPRAIWRGEGPPRDSFEIIRPPDTTQVALQMAAFIIEMLENIAGQPPVRQGRIEHSRTTAKEASIAAQGAAAFGNATTSKLQQTVMCKLLFKYYKLEQQFRAMDSYAKITGQLPEQLDIQGIIGDYNFRWFVGDLAEQALLTDQLRAQLEAMAQAQGPEAAMAQQMGMGGPNVG